MKKELPKGCGPLEKVQRAAGKIIAHARAPRRRMLAAALLLVAVLALPAGLEAGAAGSKDPALSSWTDCRVIAHALGTIDGRAETNSKDAFLSSVRSGHKVLEVDLQLTKDGYLVLRHDWDQISYYNLEQRYAGVMDRQTFLNAPICYYYTPLDMDGLLALMKEYPDIYIVTDSKDTREKDVRAQFRAMSAAVKRADDPSLWDRIVVQIYSENMMDWVKEEAPVTNWIFTLYQIAKPDYTAIGAFCRENNIPVVTIESERLNGKVAKTLHSYGLKVYVHTVNRLLAMKELSWAADGFYSDCVTPSQLEGVLRGTSSMYLSASN